MGAAPFEDVGIEEAASSSVGGTAHIPNFLNPFNMKGTEKTVGIGIVPQAAADTDIPPQLPQ